MPSDKHYNGHLSKDPRVIKILTQKIPSHENEGFKQTGIHPDFKNIPTMGYGVALADKNEQGEIILKPLNQINNEIAASGLMVKIEPKEYEDFQDFLEASPPKADVSIYIEKKLSKIRFTKEQAQKQLEFVLPNRLKDAENLAIKAGVNLVEFSPEVRAAAADLYFRGGSRLVFKEGFKSTKYLREGDEVGFLMEVLYGSNGDNKPGNDSRMFNYGKEIYKTLSEGEKDLFYERVKNEVAPAKIIAVKNRREENANLADGDFKPFDLDYMNQQAALSSTDDMSELPPEHLSELNQKFDRPNHTEPGKCENGWAYVKAHLRKGNPVKGHYRKC